LRSPEAQLRAAWSLSACLLCACLGGGNTGPGEIADINGIWRGEIRLATGPDTLVAPAQLQLERSSNSGEITGGLSYLPLGETISVAGEVDNGREVILTTAPEPVEQSDCHLFTQRLVFLPISGELRLRAASGQLCEGDGAGGHLPLRTITGGTGVLLR
jgi:hypothetical protein